MALARVAVGLRWVREVRFEILSSVGLATRERLGCGQQQHMGCPVHHRSVRWIDASTIDGWQRSVVE